MGLIAIVSLFLMLLGIPVYYGFRYLLNKFDWEERKHVWVLWTLTIVSTPILLATMVVSFFVYINYYPHREFDKIAWDSDLHKRYELMDDLITNNKLAGKSKAEVRQLLGEGSSEYESDNWSYYTGMKPGFSFGPTVLVVKYKDGKVHEVGSYVD